MYKKKKEVISHKRYTRKEYTLQYRADSKSDWVNVYTSASLEDVYRAERQRMRDMMSLPEGVRASVYKNTRIILRTERAIIMEEVHI